MCPENSALSALVLDVYTGKKTFGTCTCEACQYEGFLTSVKPCGVKLPSFIGPVPTGLGSANVAGLLTDFQMCSGTIAVPAMDCRLVNCGVAKLSTTLLPDALTWSYFTPLRLTAAVFFSMLKVKTTSAGVNGWPSFHFTPWRIAKVRGFPPLDHAYDVASHGQDFGGATRLNW